MERNLKIEWEFIEWLEKKECIAEIHGVDEYQNKYTGTCFFSNGEIQRILSVESGIYETHLKRQKEKAVVENINSMCEQSLPPEDFERWLLVKDRLIKNRKLTLPL